MNFLIDNNLSPLLAALLIELGHNAIHVKSVNMSGASDREIFQLAFSEKRIIVSADTDFGFILSEWKNNLPSIILLRFISTNPNVQLKYLKNIIENFAQEMMEGHIVVVEPTRVRIKKLPF